MLRKKKLISYLKDICHFKMARNMYPELITIEPFVTEAWQQDLQRLRTVNMF